MKNKSIVILMLMLSGIYSMAYTDHSGTISSNETWYYTGSPHRITGDITIASGVTVTIEAGCEVYFDVSSGTPSLPYAMTVYGGLICDPTQGQNITFTALNTTIGWEGINLEDPDCDSHFDYCKFEYAKKSGGGTAGSTSNSGGAIFIEDDRNESAIIITKCIFRYNSAGFGGAVFFKDYDNDNGEFELNTLYENEAGNGGAVYVYEDAPDITNCLFYHNEASMNGGAIFLNSSYIWLNHNTIADNEANTSSGSYNGGGIKRFSGKFNMRNTIIYFNSPDQTYPTVSPTTDDVEYCDIEGYSSGSNNIDADPKFVNRSVHDYRISYNNVSPCIDEGDNSASPMTSVDLKGDDRTILGDPLKDDVTDIGVYEYEAPSPDYKFINLPGNEEQIVEGLKYYFSEDFLVFSCNFKKGKCISFDLFDMYGRRFKTFLIGNTGEGLQVFYYNLSDLLSGCYVYKITVDNYQYSTGQFFKP